VQVLFALRPASGINIEVDVDPVSFIADALRLVKR
jgi:hypothetical protein